MDDFENFSVILAEFGKRMETELSFQDDYCSFVVDARVIVNLNYLPQSDMVVAWASVGTLPQDELAGDRALAFLRMNDLATQTHGFTLSCDGDDNRLLAQDLRPASLFTDVDALAAWVEDLADLVMCLREYTCLNFPAHDVLDDFPEDAIDEDDGLPKITFHDEGEEHPEEEK